MKHCRCTGLPVLLALVGLLGACDYHANAFDPQLHPGQKDPDTGSPGLDTGAMDAGDAGAETGVAGDLAAELAGDQTAGESGGELAGDVASAPGCTDPKALNYDPLATEDDGSCLFNVTLTFQLDMSCYPKECSPQVAGGNTFGMPGDHPMTDSDDDGIWTVDITLPPALGTGYTYTSKVCTDWSCKENIAGQSCAQPPYNDRYLNTGTEDHAVQECFGHCGQGFCGQCPLGSPAPGGSQSCQSPQVRVEFFVDVSGNWAVAQKNVIALHGSFDGPAPGFGQGIVMERLAGKKLFKVALCLDPETDYTFRFGSYKNTNSASEFPENSYPTDQNPCPGATQTVACDAGTCTARLLHTGVTDQTLQVAKWGSCESYTWEEQR